MKTIYPARLKKGDEIRVIAPARSLGLLTQEGVDGSVAVLKKMGYKITFGKHVSEKDMFISSSVESRVADLHDAFRDKNVKAILTVIGGFNSNQLLHHLDYNLIKKNPKILCGYSDITALSNAIYAKTGLVGYSGLHFATFRMPKGNEYSIKSFEQCLCSTMPYEITPSKEWSDDQWWMPGAKYNPIKNEGWWVLQKGKGNVPVSGTLIGGNLGTFNLLQGTAYAPSLKDVVIFAEEDEQEKESTDVMFDRALQSLLQQKDLRIKALVIGRFQKASVMTKEKLQAMVNSKSQLKGIPIIANVDFGHTMPLATFPIGGVVQVSEKKIEVIKH